MPDTLGWRKLFGVLTPSVNTVVQPEMDAMRPPGVTNHIARMFVQDKPVGSEKGMNDSLAEIDRAIEGALDQIITANPDHIILGVSAESIWGGGPDSPRRIVERIQSRAGRKIGVTQATDAFPAGLKALGIRRKIALLTPYHPSSEPHIRMFFDSIGYEIVKSVHLNAGGILKIANVSEAVLRESLASIAADDVEAIVQFGANLPMGKVAAEAERWLGKPILAVNTAVYWHALRSNDINDKLYGFGRLLWEH